jgi:predicted O-methyltransferase YrrM
MISDYLSYLLKAKSAHGIHSPFVYDFIVQILQSKHPFYAFEPLEKLRFELEKSELLIDYIEMGAGSKKLSGSKRKISSIAKHGISKKKYSELLFRIIAKYEFKNILELGTSIGLNTLYLCKANENANVKSLEGNPSLCEFAKNLAVQNQIHNLEIIEGNFDNTLPGLMSKSDKIDFVFIDGNHTHDATLRYINLILPKLDLNAVIILDDIYWSKQMKQAWNEAKELSMVSISIDLFQFGVLFFTSLKKEKEHFILKF